MQESMRTNTYTDERQKITSEVLAGWPFLTLVNISEYQHKSQLHASTGIRHQQNKINI